METCGILSGVLDSKRALFTINTLIVPKQEGTSDRVEALNEEEIFEAQDSRKLYPLGWIHTHPSHTCFLSSIDIHTQYPYQVPRRKCQAGVLIQPWSFPCRTLLLMLQSPFCWGKDCGLLQRQLRAVLSVLHWCAAAAKVSKVRSCFLNGCTLTAH